MVRTCRARSMLRRRRLPWRRAAARRLWSRAGGGAGPGWQLVGSRRASFRELRVAGLHVGMLHVSARSGAASGSPLRVLGQLLGTTDREGGRLCRCVRAERFSHRGPGFGFGSWRPAPPAGCTRGLRACPGFVGRSGRVCCHCFPHRARVTLLCSCLRPRWALMSVLGSLGPGAPIHNLCTAPCPAVG